MTAINQKKNENNKAIKSVAAGVAGALAVAGVAVAATMAMKDEKTREKVKKVLIDVKDKAIEYIDTLKTEPGNKKETNSIKKIATSIKEW